MGHVDLDAARSEALAKPNTAKFNGRVFTLLPWLPIDAALAYRRAFIEPAEDDAEATEAIFEFARLVLADVADLDAFRQGRPSREEVRALIGAFVPDGDAGESSPSRRSSPKGGKRSRATSPRTTKSS